MSTVWVSDVRWGADLPSCAPRPTPLPGQLPSTTFDRGSGEHFCCCSRLWSRRCGRCSDLQRCEQWAGHGSSHLNDASLRNW